MMKNTMFNQRGFTLIELLVVVLIIGILASVALPQYTKAVEKTRATEAITNMRTVVNNVEMVILAEGNHEDSSVYANPDNWDVEISGGHWVDSGCCGPMYVTKNFYYLVRDDQTGVGAYRCVGTCTDDINQDSVYDLWMCYPSVDGGKCLLCFSNTDEGKKICKSLTGLGVENRS